MKQHTSHGRDIPSEYEDLEPMVKDTAHFHHERIDGKGYPEGTDGVICASTFRMITIVDTYDAITSARLPRALPLHWMRCRFCLPNGQHFDKEMVGSLYPDDRHLSPGSLVEMSNGGGIVVSSNRNIACAHGWNWCWMPAKAAKPYIINLADSVLDGQGEVY